MMMKKLEKGQIGQKMKKKYFLLQPLLKSHRHQEYLQTPLVVK